MRYLKTTDLITLLPIDYTLKIGLKEKFAHLTDEERMDYEQMLWNIFSEYKEKLENIYYQEALAKVEQKKQELTADLMQKAKEEVREEFENILSGKKEDQQKVKEIQEKLQGLIVRH